jgi:aminoglycoside phosphotransferase (APT) family kinase protein
MPEPQRDLEDTREQLRKWFATKLPKAQDLEIANLAGPGTTGFSNDTLMLDLAWKQEGWQRREGLVVRIKPTGFQVFPEYDLGLQFRVMGQLARHGVPVPKMFWQEEEDGVLGAPFYVMERVEGRIPTDNPTYHTGGWMTEIPPEDRTAIWWSGLETMARIHRLDWKAAGFEFLDTPESEKTPLERQLDYYRRYFEWTRTDKPQPTIKRAFEWLERNQPRSEPVGLCWGDSRLGNMIFRDNRCVAVLDWEMVALGNPEQDFAWWLFLDDHHSVGLGAERLAGIPPREQSIARYQEWTGIEVKHLEYYQVFAALRFGVIMIRVAQRMAVAGLLPADSTFESNNTPTQMLAKMLNLPPPDQA